MEVTGNEAFVDFLTWGTDADSSSPLSWAVSPLLLLLCCCKRRQPEGLGTRFAPVPEGGEGVMQPWRIEGARPEDRVSNLSLPGKQKFSMETECLLPMTQHTKLNSVKVLNVKHLPWKNLFSFQDVSHICGPTTASNTQDRIDSSGQ